LETSTSRRFLALTARRFLTSLRFMADSRRARRVPFLPVLCLVVALIGMLFIAQRGNAQPAAVPTMPPAAALPGPKGAKKDAPPAKADAEKPEKPAAKADDKKDDDKKKKDKGDYVDPESYAVLGPKGGVPTHPDGAYRSPFAHPTWGEPLKVRVGVLMNSVRDYDIKEGTFEADFFLSLTSERPMPPMEIIFANGKKDKDAEDVLTDLPTFKLYRLGGTFHAPPNLRQYPFDTQELTIELEDHNTGVDQLVFVADRPHTNLGVGFNVTGWSVSYVKARVVDFYYPDRFDDDDLYYSRYKVSLGLQRYGTSAAFTVFVPAIVIVLISLSGLWLPRVELEVRSNASAPMLAAAVLFHFALMQALPPTPYLTRADKLMLAVYASLILNMLATWLWFVFDEKWEHAVFLWGRRIVPPVTVGLVLAGSFALRVPGVETAKIEPPRRQRTPRSGSLPRRPWRLGGCF
jgi:hypothetical protein